MIFAAIAKEFPAVFHRREIFLLPGFSFDLSKEKRIKFIVKSLNNVLGGCAKSIKILSKQLRHKSTKSFIFKTFFLVSPI